MSAIASCTVRVHVCACACVHACGGCVRACVRLHVCKRVGEERRRVGRERRSESGGALECARVGWNAAVCAMHVGVCIPATGPLLPPPLSSHRPLCTNITSATFNGFCWRFPRTALSLTNGGHIARLLACFASCSSLMSLLTLGFLSQLYGLGGSQYSHDEVMAKLSYFLKTAGAIPLLRLPEMEALNSKVWTPMLQKRFVERVNTASVPVQRDGTGPMTWSCCPGGLPPVTLELKHRDMKTSI